MKKWIVLILAAVVLLSLMGCKNPSAESDEKNTESEIATVESSKSDTQTETSGSGDEKKSIIPTDIVGSFMALCEENKGFDMKVAWVTGKSLRIGGKDNVFWYDQRMEDGTRSLMIGKLVDGEWQDVTYLISSDDVSTSDTTGQMTVQTAAEMAYNAQGYFTDENASTAMIQHQGLDCTRYEGVLDLTIDVVKQYGVTARYLSPNEVDTYSVLYIKTGDEAIVPETK